MADNRILIDVELNQARAEKEAVRLTRLIAKQREELRKYRKVLKESNGDNEDAARQVAILSQDIKENSKDLRLNQREMSAASNTTEGLRIETNRLQREQNKLNTSTEEGAKEFARLEEVLKSNREALNANSQAAGSYKDNIGNYKNSVLEALEANSSFVAGLQGVVEGYRTATASAKAFRVALAATGIGVIIGLLSSFFTQTRQGRQIIERFGAVTTAIFSEIAQVGKALFNSFGTLFQDFSSGIKEFWNNPIETAKQSAIDLGDAILENLINRVNGFIGSVKIVGTALKQVFEGEFSKAIETAKGLGTTVVQTFTGASKDSIDEFGNSIKELGNDIADTVTRADKLALANISLRASIRALRVESADQQREAEKNRKARDDEFKSLAERLALNEKVGIAEEKRRDALLALNKAQQQVLRNDIALQGGEATEEQLDQLSELNAEALEIQEDFLGRTTEQLTEANSIRREELQAQANFEAALLEEQIIRGELKGGELLEKRLAILAKEREAALVGLKEGSIERQLVEQEFTNRRLELQKAEQEQQVEQEEAFAEMQTERRNERLQLELEAERRALEQKKAIADASKAVDDARAANAQKSVDLIIAAFGKESIAGKAAFLLKQGLAIADVFVNLQSQLSLIAVKAQEIALTTPGIVGAVAGTVYQVQQSTQASVGAALSVANIAAQTVSGFAGGGTVDSLTGKPVPNKSFAGGGSTGPGGTRTPKGAVHGGEFVVPNRQVNALGGVSNVARITGTPVNGFAGGGSVDFGSFQNRQAIQATRGVESNLSKMQVQVAVTDIQKANKRYNSIQTKVNA